MAIERSPSAGSGTGVGSTLAQGLVLTAALGATMRASIGTPASSIVRACALYSAIMTLVVRSLPAYHPFSRFGAANQVTTIRAAIVSLLAGFIGEPPTSALAWVVVVLAALATMLDGVDGWLARRSGLVSPLGARFDLEVDALLILVLALLAWRFGKAGPWIVLAGLLRYAFVAGGWAVAWMRRPLPASRRRQTACIAQIVALICALLPHVPPTVSVWISALALCALVASFAIDAAWLWQRSARPNLQVPS